MTTETATPKTSAVEALAKIQETIERAKKIDSVEARTAALETAIADFSKFKDTISEKLRSESLTLPGSEADAHKYSFTNIVRYYQGDTEAAKFEREISRATLDHCKRHSPLIHDRVMSTATPSAGGFLIPEEMMPGVLPKFQAQAIVDKVGATVIKPKGWPFKINSMTGTLTAAYAAEGGTGSASDLTFAQLQLNPRKMTARCVVTQEQLGYGTESTDQLIQAELGTQLALLRDYWALIGTGMSMPLGVFNYSAASSPTAQQIATVAGVTSGSLRFVDVANALKKLEGLNVGIEGAALVCHPDLKWEMFQDAYTTVSSGTVANQGAALYMPVPIASEAKFKELTGYMLACSTQLPTTSAIVGLFANLFIGEWGGTVVQKSDIASDGTTHAFFADCVHIKATRWIDTGAARPNAFCTITSV